MRIAKLGVVARAALITALALSACGGDTEASSGEVCDSLRAVAAAADANENVDPTESLDALSSSLEDFADVAPPDIEDEAATLLDGTKRMVAQASGHEEADDEDPTMLEDEEYESAGNRVAAYAKRSCGVSIG